MGTLKRRIIEDMEPTEYELARRWIPVEERLPERYIRVLAWVKCDPHEHPHGIGFIGSMGFWSLDELRHDPSAEVTHWMPLPEPPMRKSIEEKIRDHVCDTLGVPRGQVAEPVSEDDVVGLMPAPKPPEVK